MSEQSLSLTWVSLRALSLDDLAWLKRAGEAGPAYEHITPEQIIEGMQEGKLHVFRFVPGPGALLVEVLANPANGIKRLSLIRAAGRGVGWTFPQIADLLKRTAREWGCEGVETRVYGTQRRLAEAMQKVGAKVESITLFLEAGNG